MKTNPGKPQPPAKKPHRRQGVTRIKALQKAAGDLFSILTQTNEKLQIKYANIRV